VQRAIEKDAEDFQFDDFGYFEYRFRWKASAPHVDGCIVQKIERSATVDGEQIIDEPYWEAWEVAGGEILGPDGKKLTAGAHDSWVNLERKWGTSGEWRIDATVYWVPREEWAALAAKFGANAVPAAGMLLATTSDPGLSGGALFTHWKGGAWDGRTVEAARNLLRKWRAEGTFPLNDEGEEDHGQAAHELKEDNEFASEVVAEAIAELDKG
jgi:hypothetical protein